MKILSERSFYKSFLVFDQNMHLTVCFTTLLKIDCLSSTAIDYKDYHIVVGNQRMSYALFVY